MLQLVDRPYLRPRFLDLLQDVQRQYPGLYFLESLDIAAAAVLLNDCSIPRRRAFLNCFREDRDVSSFAAYCRSCERLRSPLFPSASNQGLRYAFFFFARIAFDSSCVAESLSEDRAAAAARLRRSAFYRFRTAFVFLSRLSSCLPTILRRQVLKAAQATFPGFGTPSFNPATLRFSAAVGSTPPPSLGNAAAGPSRPSFFDDASLDGPIDLTQERNDSSDSSDSERPLAQRSSAAGSRARSSRGGRGGGCLGAGRGRGGAPPSSSQSTPRVATRSQTARAPLLLAADVEYYEKCWKNTVDKSPYTGEVYEQLITARCWGAEGKGLGHQLAAKRAIVVPRDKACEACLAAESVCARVVDESTIADSELKGNAKRVRKCIECSRRGVNCSHAPPASKSATTSPAVTNSVLLSATPTVKNVGKRKGRESGEESLSREKEKRKRQRQAAGSRTTSTYSDDSIDQALTQPPGPSSLVAVEVPHTPRHQRSSVASPSASRSPASVRFASSPARPPTLPTGTLDDALNAVNSAQTCSRAVLDIMAQIRRLTLGWTRPPDRTAQHQLEEIIGLYRQALQHDPMAKLYWGPSNEWWVEYLVDLAGED